MPQILERLRCERRKRNNMFSKRRKTFFRNARNLQQDCAGTDIFVIVRNRWNNQIWQYSNNYNPPTKDEMVIDRFQST
jgi:hypothetical protein